MNICFIGTGYVGLVSGVLFSDFGNNLDESIQTLKIIESAKLSNRLNKVIEI